MIDNGASTLPTKLDRERVTNTEDPKGFSLMELLVVIAIIGVIAAIGTPQLLGMRARSSVRADARDLHSTYRQAQTEAVKRSFDACVEIDDVASTYQIQMADYFNFPAKRFRPGNSVNITDLVGVDLCFNNRGLPESGGGTTVRLKNIKSSYTMAVSLSHSGHVKSENQ